MNFNGLPIGSILNATESQFISLYRKAPPSGDTQESFVEEYKNKQNIGLKDAEELQKLGISAQQIGEKLNKIVEKANQTYRSNIPTQPIKSLSIDFKRPVIDVEEDGSFKVSGMDLRIMGSEKCAICEHKVSAPATYQIKNTQTGEKLRFPELTLHLILKHDYFAKPGGPYRIEPSRVCKVLGFTK